MPRKSNSRAAQGNGTIRKKTITRNGKTYQYWEARYTAGHDPGTGKQIQRSITGKTQKEVAQKLKAATASIDNGTYMAPSKQTVGEWLDIWADTYLGGVKPFTVASYKTQIKNHIKPALGAVRLEALDTPTIQRFYNRLAKEGRRVPKHDERGHVVKHDGKTVYDVGPLSPKTIKNIHGVLHKALQQAIAAGLIRFNPADACTLPRIVKKELTPFDEAQSRDFLDAIKGHKYEDLFTVVLFTGMREGEALGLLWECVDFDKGTILIKQQLQREKKKGGAYVYAPLKNDKARTITPAPWVMGVLRAHKARQAQQRLMAGPMWEDSGLAFTDEKGHHLAIHTVYTAFKKAAASIGRPDARFHDLRHSYAVAAIRSGDDIKTVQGNLGHATAGFTLDVYGHVTDQMKEASAARMENYIKGVLHL
jgi:integrase